MTDREKQMNKNPPLSQAPGRKKILIGVPAALLLAGLTYMGWGFRISGMLAVILGAYAIVGVVEIIGGESLVNLGKQWDALAGWKKFFISIAVIVIFFTALMLIMPTVAEYFQ
jgi:hypothetical protein